MIAFYTCCPTAWDFSLQSLNWQCISQGFWHGNIQSIQFLGIIMQIGYSKLFSNWVLPKWYAMLTTTDLPKSQSHSILENQNARSRLKTVLNWTCFLQLEVHESSNVLLFWKAISIPLFSVVQVLASIEQSYYNCRMYLMISISLLQLTTFYCCYVLESKAWVWGL